MTQDNNRQDESVQVMFDVANPTESLGFMGLLEPSSGSQEGLQAMFSWECPACAALNRKMATVIPGQASLTEWACSYCSRRLVVQFRGRSAPDWIIQHNLAITRESLRRSGEASDSEAGATGVRNANQWVFASLAVPALIALMLIGISDVRRIQPLHAGGQGWIAGRASPSYSWLGGRWIGKDSDHHLFFGYVNQTAGEGAYTRVMQAGKSSDLVRFRIVHEETTDGRLVLEELDSKALLYIARYSNHLVRVTTQDGRPVVTTYQRLDDTHNQNRS